MAAGGRGRYQISGAGSRDKGSRLRMYRAAANVSARAGNWLTGATRYRVNHGRIRLDRNVGQGVFGTEARYLWCPVVSQPCACNDVENSLYLILYPGSACCSVKYTVDLVFTCGAAYIVRARIGSTSFVSVSVTVCLFDSVAGLAESASLVQTQSLASGLSYTFAYLRVVSPGPLYVVGRRHPGTIAGYG